MPPVHSSDPAYMSSIASKFLLQHSPVVAEQNGGSVQITIAELSKEVELMSLQGVNCVCIEFRPSQKN